MTRLLRGAALAVAAAAAPLALVVGPLVGPASASTTYDGPVEDYSSYQPQQACRTTPRLGTVELAAWIDATYGAGPALASMRACDSGGVSEHKAGRAIDWMVDATDDDQRAEAKTFLRDLFAPDADGNAQALARRMGVMYVIFNDHMWASYDHFDRKDYRNGACPSLTTCSTTLRHRDHVHISLSRPGARAETSWYSRD